MKRPLTIRQFISQRKLSIVALSSNYLSALKVREHDAKQGLLGAFAGACTPRVLRGYPKGKFNNKRRNRQPLGYYTQIVPDHHLNSHAYFRKILSDLREAKRASQALDVPSIPSPTENQN